MAQPIADRAARKKWAILIGVNRYINVVDLRFCSRDVESLQKSLIGLGFPERNIFMLHDNAKERKNEPFGSNIRKVLNLLLGELDDKGEKLVRPGLVSKDDLVVVAFSGHGVHLDGESYFCPVDAELGKNHTLVPLKRLYRLLVLSPASVKLMLVDACRNDPRVRGVKSLRTASENRKLASSLAAPPKGVLVLSSCAPGQVSLEDTGLRHSVFMKNVLDGLSGAADRSEGNRNGRVSLLELYRYASSHTKSYVARRNRILQTPTLHGEITGDFEFGKIGNKPVVPPTNKPTLKKFTNRLGMEFRLIPAGEFLMGSPDTDRDALSYEKPQHRVRISKPFYMGATEVTQEQWAAVMGSHPWRGNRHVKEGDNCPATYISWDDAVKFCRKLSEREAGAYRLPTEAEWGYACRAGSTTRFSYGEDAEHLGAYAWFDDNADENGESYAHSVGQKKPNAWGLHGMHGNVREWCSDWYAKYTVQLPITIDPRGPSKGSDRVLRGGCWNSFTLRCRSAYRYWSPPSHRFNDMGFRVVRSASQ